MEKMLGNVEFLTKYIFKNHLFEMASKSFLEISVTCIAFILLISYKPISHIGSIQQDGKHKHHLSLAFMF
jgi:hypothetical protein